MATFFERHPKVKSVLLSYYDPGTLNYMFIGAAALVLINLPIMLTVGGLGSGMESMFTLLGIGFPVFALGNLFYETAWGKNSQRQFPWEKGSPELEKEMRSGAHVKAQGAVNALVASLVVLGAVYVMVALLGVIAMSVTDAASINILSVFQPIGMAFFGLLALKVVTETYAYVAEHFDWTNDIKPASNVPSSNTQTRGEYDRTPDEVREKYGHPKKPGAHHAYPGNAAEKTKDDIDSSSKNRKNCIIL